MCTKDGIRNNLGRARRLISSGDRQFLPLLISESGRYIDANGARRMSRLTKVSSASGSPALNVIVFHGLGSSSSKTWRQGKTNDELWLPWLSADAEGVSVWTVDYDAAKTDWSGFSMDLHDRAINILGTLAVDPEIVSAPILLVAHSFGGIVVKKILREADASVLESHQQFLSQIRSAVFLATPHSGAALATVGNWLSRVSRASKSTKTINLDDPNLTDLNNWYINFCTKRRISHLIYYETKEIWPVGLIVTKNSANPGIPNSEIFSSEGDHITMCWISDKKSSEYNILLKFITAIIEKEGSNKILFDPITRGNAKFTDRKGRYSTRIQNHRSELISSGDNKAFNILFCGFSTANPKTKSEIFSKTLIDQLRAEKFNVIVGGDVGLQDENLDLGSNPLSNELNYMSSKCNAVVIVADGIETWSELGLLSWHFAHNQEIEQQGTDFILISDNKYRATSEFIKKGPFALVNNRGSAQFNDLDKLDPAIIVDRLKGRRSLYTIDARGRSKGRAN